MDKNTLTVYWAGIMLPSYSEFSEAVYMKPESVKHNMQNKYFENSAMKVCPAVKGVTNNLFTIKSSFKEKINIDVEKTKKVFLENNNVQLIPGDKQTKIPLISERDYEYEGFFNYSYKLSWLLFSNEPLEVKATAPYLPPTSPVKGGFLIPGKFDIGRWYRPISLEYLVPHNAKTFKINKDEDIIFLEFLTDKKIIFKEYQISDNLYEMAKRFSQSPQKDGPFKSLKERYGIAEKKDMKKNILSEIKKNLIDE